MDARAVLDEYLRAGRKVALRLTTSMGRLPGILPLRAETITRLTEDEESMPCCSASRHWLRSFKTVSDARCCQRKRGNFSSHRVQVIASRSSRKDKGLLIAKLGALDETVSFGEVAESRNRLSHSFPDDPERQADVMNTGAERSVNPRSAFNGMLIYARKLDVGTDLEEVASTVPSPGLAR